MAVNYCMLFSETDYQERRKKLNVKFKLFIRNKNCLADYCVIPIGEHILTAFGTCSKNLMSD